MSAVQLTKLGVTAAGLSCLLVVGYAQAQQVEEQVKPAQYSQQNTRQPLGDRVRRNERRQGERRQNIQGERTTTHFRGPDAVGSSESNSSHQSANASVDNYLANCLLMKNQAEIEVSQFAKERSQSDEVKQFAQQMVDDHRQLAEKLEQVAATNGNSNRTASDNSVSAHSNTAGNDAAFNQLLEIDRRITDECTRMTRDKLESLSGNEFDQHYVGSQLGGHMHMLAALNVISEQADGELRQIAEDAKSKVKDHLQHAEKLMEKLESQKSS